MHADGVRTRLVESRIEVGGLADRGQLKLGDAPSEYRPGAISLLTYNPTSMPACEVEYTDEFGSWWDSLKEEEQDSVDFYVGLLEGQGVALGHPYSSGVESSRHAHMRELRIQHAGQPYRVFYAFDPRRCAMLLIGGAKGGRDRFYEEMVPIADKIYDQHLIEIAKEKK